MITPGNDVRVMYEPAEITYWSSKHGISFSVPVDRHRIWAVEFGEKTNAYGERWPFDGSFGRNIVLISDANAELIGRVRFIGEPSVSLEEVNKTELQAHSDSARKATVARGGSGRLSIEKKAEQTILLGNESVRKFTYTIGYQGSRIPYYRRELQWFSVRTQKATLTISVYDRSADSGASPDRLMEYIIKTFKPVKSETFEIGR